MNLGLKCRILYDGFEEKFLEQFGFYMRDVTFGKIVTYLHEPKDSSSLAVTRILFGLAMLFDIPDERGGSTMDKRWGQPNSCHFPLLPFVRALPLPYMALIYGALWFGAVGIMLGYKYRITAPLFTICYWYLFLIEKSFWNNHSYLFGLLALLLSCTEANCYWSIDVRLDPSLMKVTVPYWNYFILKYQLFILYTVAGLKKGTTEWLTGYSVQSLAEHWVFGPFKIFLTVEQIDYLIVHCFIFVFDLTVAAWMMWGSTRNVAMLFCALFHLMNTRLFKIGLFPWVCLVTMPLFYSFDWPKTALINLKCLNLYIKENIYNFVSKIANNRTCSSKAISIGDKDIFDGESSDDDDNGVQIYEVHSDQNDRDFHEDNSETEQKTYNKTLINEKRTPVSQKLPKEIISEEIEQLVENDCPKESTQEPVLSDDVGLRKKITTIAIIIYVFLQMFLPYSHFLTKGYNNWTNGLYGYSWDMMVHTWESHSVVVKLVDNNSNKEFYIDPSRYTPNDRWTRHGDMVHQYAVCLKKIVEENGSTVSGPKLSNNISIYIDIWYSMNGRFTQRMFDPKVDLLQASWSPFKTVPYLMPLLDEALHWRSVLDDIRREALAWSNASDVIFLADFPGYDQEKYIPFELKNITLTVLGGTVVFDPEVSKLSNGQSYKLTGGNHINIYSGLFHKVINIGSTPAYYMYTFVNSTLDIDQQQKPSLPVAKELYTRFENMIKFFKLVITNIFRTTCFSMSGCT